MVSYTQSFLRFFKEGALNKTIIFSMPKYAQYATTKTNVLRASQTLHELNLSAKLPTVGQLLKFHAKLAILTLLEEIFYSVKQPEISN